MDSLEPEQTPFAAVSAQTSKIGRQYQAWLDKSTPYVPYRWLTTFGLLLLFFIRIFVAQGWYIVAYSLGIYLLNLFLAFLQPKFDPSNEAIDNDMEDGAVGGLPTKQDEEFRPFIRRLPEFKFLAFGYTGNRNCIGCVLVDSIHIDHAKTNSTYDQVPIRTVLVRQNKVHQE
ncbi:hypothetical protein DID88_000771 [Monilinia fructigena]|uniref:Protein RER1 n=1 Tax=Monilinia fructigena TaxID=38457 RepID=A0A395IIX2_9HELO|nr:hypothetical protein DID88_000771 [Monilinia fructigena]